MANVSTMVGIEKGDGRLIQATNSSRNVLLDPDIEYTVAHLGVDIAAAAVTDTVFMASGAVPTADYVNDSTSKFALKASTALTIGPGISALYFITAANSPVFQIIVGKHHFGQW